MKPEHWDKMTADQKRSVAHSLMQSLRGHYIISQALSVAIDTMKKVPQPHREESNISDMEILREQIFGLYFQFEGKQLQKLIKKKRRGKKCK